MIVLHPGRPKDSEALDRKAARAFESRKSLVLDWAGGVRGSRVWLVIKILAADAATGRNREFRLDVDDLAALREVVPKGCRWRKRERGR